MAELRLLRGETALVDEEDLPRCLPHRWRLVKVGRKTNKQMIYVAAKIGNRNNVYLHRFLLDEPPGIRVDHRDRNPLNCQKANLRLATRFENAQNKSKHSTWRGSPTKSRYRGVTWRRKLKKWVAVITAKGAIYYLGSFFDEISAAEAYDNAAIAVHGAFANLNFPERIAPLSTGLPELGELGEGRQMVPDGDTSHRINGLPEIFHPALRKRLTNIRNKPKL